VTITEQFCRSVFPSSWSVVESSVVCLLFLYFHQHSHLLSNVPTEFSPKCSLVRCPHGIHVRLPACPCGRIGHSHSRNLPSASRYERPGRAAHCNASAQGAACPGPRHHRHCEIPPQGQGSSYCSECGAGKTYMALGTIQVLADGRPSATLVMCPSHITHKWARELC